MNRLKLVVVAVGIGLVGCGGLGATDAPVSLASAGVNATVDLPTGGKVGTSFSGGAEVRWSTGLSFAASFELTQGLSATSNHPLTLDASSTYDAQTPVVVNGKSYTCWVQGKKEAEAKRLQAVCDKLAAASPKVPAGGAPATFELVDQSASAVGCSIKIPKGAKTLMEDKYNTTYSLPLPDGLNELNVSVNQAGAASLDDAKRTATIMSGTAQDAKKLPNGLLEVLLAPEGTLQTVATFLPKFGAKCTGPTANLATLTQMCESLTAGDKVGTASAPAEKAPTKEAAVITPAKAGAKPAAALVPVAAKPAPAKPKGK
jgi:hypothetical protein